MSDVLTYSAESPVIATRGSQSARGSKASPATGPLPLRR